MISSPSVAPSPHARGVFRQIHALNGSITFHVYRCDGELMEIAQVHPDWHPDRMQSELGASLDANCPLDPAMHREMCPGSYARLRLA